MKLLFLYHIEILKLLSSKTFEFRHIIYALFILHISLTDHKGCLCLVSCCCPLGAFWLYSGFAALGFTFMWLFLPETKGKHLEEVELLFKGSKFIPCASRRRASEYERLDNIFNDDRRWFVQWDYYFVQLDYYFVQWDYYFVHWDYYFVQSNCPSPMCTCVYSCIYYKSHIPMICQLIALLEFNSLY